MERQLDPSGLGDHIDRLFRAAWALTGSREDAEDLVQDTYVRVLRRPRFIRGEDDLAYLLKVLRNTFLNRLRTRSRRPQTTLLPEGHEFVEERTSTQPERALEAREIYEAIAELADDHRDVLVAVDVMGLSYREAAAALGTREGTVMSRLYRARQQIARRFR
jgi:RNA polymerase sigma-70 factor, ECF subfamily